MLKRWDPAVEPHWLLLLAGLLWTAVGLMLCLLAIGWWTDAPPSLSAPIAVVGIVAALLIYRFGFLKLARANMARIDAISDLACVFAFQAWKSWLIVIFMMSLGLLLRGSIIPKHYLAVLYFGIGGGMFLSSLHYYRRLLFPAR